MQKPEYLQAQQAKTTALSQEQQLKNLQIQKAQQDLIKQPEVWAKLDDGTLYNQATGETKKP